MLSANKTISFLLGIITSEYEFATFRVGGWCALDLIGLTDFGGGIFGKGFNELELLIKVLLLSIALGKDTLAQVFSCAFCEISNNTFSTEHL